MGAYFFRRALLMIPTFLGITFLVFTITRFVPGGPIEQMMVKMQMAESEAGGGSSNFDGSIQIPDSVREELEKQFGFDKPFYLAYLDWVSDVLVLDLGTSYKYRQPVWDIVKSWISAARRMMRASPSPIDKHPEGSSSAFLLIDSMTLPVTCSAPIK